MPIDPKTEALARLRPTMKEASVLVVLLGYSLADFLDAVVEETNIEVLRDVLVLLPLQKVDSLKNGREKNDIAQRLVQEHLTMLGGEPCGS